MKKTVNCFGMIIIFGFALLVLFKPEICIKSAINGLIACGNVIIPSIYPFSFCVLFLHNGGAYKLFQPFDKIINKFFHFTHHEFALFLFSLIGGYPMGAKLLADSKNDNAHQMINFCINAGPAFIILAIGKGIFKNITIGWLLFIAHIIPSFIILLFLKNKIKPQSFKSQPINIINNFVISASNSADTVIKICALVILFSCVGGYIEYLSAFIKPLSYIGLLCEVTTAVFKCKNILTISFLLGFSGFSIWAQIFFLLKNVKLNYLKFIFFRLLHGSFSAVIMFVLLKIFKINISTLSNNAIFSYNSFINGPAVAISLIIMGLVLIISLYNKKFAGNLIEDIV